MKIPNHTPNIESSGDLEEQLFSIGDTGMIFDILRSKMYSNPILAICREYSCNALDAHREVNTPDIPVEITLPTHIEHFYKIKDYGPGLSPDRVANIFIKYCASTKREDNNQIGAFGLGAKSAFSYVDSFTIITRFNGVQYNYVCYIDETKVGKLSLLSETATQHQNGTEIIIPVKKTDFHFFTESTERSTRHWKVKPSIKNGSVNYKTLNKVLEGSNWAIASPEQSYTKSVKAIIDGIEYPLDIQAMRQYADASIIDSMYGDLIFYFNNGELSLSSSREQVFLDKRTQDKLKERIEFVNHDIKNMVQDKVNNFTSYWDANCFWRDAFNKIFYNLGFLGTIKWNNIDLLDNHVYVNCPVFMFSKGKYSRKTGLDKDKLSRARTTSITFLKNSKIVINDTAIKEPTPKHIKKMFTDNPTLQTAYVICFTDKVTEASLNKSIHLDKMEPAKLSSFTKATGNSRTASSRLLTFKYNLRLNKFGQVSYDSIEEDTNTIKVLCKLDKPYNRDSERSVIFKKINTNFFVMDALQKHFPNVSFYGIDKDIPEDKLEEAFEDFENIEDFIDEKVANNSSINFAEMKYAKTQGTLDQKAISLYQSSLKEFNDPNSIFLQRAVAHLKIKKITESNSGLLSIYESYKGEYPKHLVTKFLQDNPHQDLHDLDKKCQEKYPLYYIIDYYQYSRAQKQIIHYINLIDKG